MEQGNGQRSLANFWRGMFLGAVVGTIVTMLYTPRTGGEMRSTIKDTAGKTKSRIGEWRHKSTNEQKAEDLQSVV